MKNWFDIVGSPTTLKIKDRIHFSLLPYIAGLFLVCTSCNDLDEAGQGPKVRRTYSEVMNSNIDFSDSVRIFKEKEIHEKALDIVAWKMQLPEWVILTKDSSWIYLFTHLDDYLSYGWSTDIVLYVHDSAIEIRLYDESIIVDGSLFNNPKNVDTVYLQDNKGNGRVEWFQHSINQYKHTDQQYTLIPWDKRITHNFDANLEYWYKTLCK